MEIISSQPLFCFLKSMDLPDFFFPEGRKSLSLSRQEKSAPVTELPALSAHKRQVAKDAEEAAGKSQKAAGKAYVRQVSPSRQKAPYIGSAADAHIKDAGKIDMATGAAPVDR